VRHKGGKDDKDEDIKPLEEFPFPIPKVI